MDKMKQKQEAMERMKQLRLYPNIIKEFAKEDIVNLSEHGGMLYWLNADQKKIVREFEEKYNAVVYHVIHNNTEFGELYSLLYVSEYEKEWEDDKSDLTDGCPIAYVKNIDDDICSEFGSIGIRMQFGGLVRTA